MPRGMKRGALTGGATLQRLDGLLRLLARALGSRHAAVASLALRCLCHAARLPLPGTRRVTLWRHTGQRQEGLADRGLCKTQLPQDCCTQAYRSLSFSAPPEIMLSINEWK
jgi:hypothetical protein